MKKILKYEVPISLTKYELPRSSQFIHFGFDGKGDVCLWVYADPTEDKQQVQAFVIMTGEELLDPIRMFHLGTLVGNGIVCHCFIDTQLPVYQKAYAPSEE